MGFDTNNPGQNSVQQADLDTPFSDLEAVYGSPVNVGTGNLRLDSGQSLEDGSGTRRFRLLPSQTIIQDDGGNIAFEADTGRKVGPFATSTTPYVIQDQQGAFRAVEYFTSSSAPGALRLANAVMDFRAGKASTSGDSMTADPETDTEDGFIVVDVSGTRFQIPVYSP